MHLKETLASSNAPRSSTAAALFLATILLLAAASALAQAPAPAPAPGPSSSPCPLGLSFVLSGSLTPTQSTQIIAQLSSSGQSNAIRCLCIAANGSTILARETFNKLVFQSLGGLLGLGQGLVTISINVNALNCTRLGA